MRMGITFGLSWRIMIIETIVAAIIMGGATIYANRKRKQAHTADKRAAEAESRAKIIVQTSQEDWQSR